MALTPGKWEFYQTGSYEVSYGIKAPAPRHWVIPPLNLNPDDVRLMACSKELFEALQSALLVIQDYLDYDHDGDPWSEDARLMVEMEINDYKRDGRLNAALSVISKATGQCLKGKE